MSDTPTVQTEPGLDFTAVLIEHQAYYLDTGLLICGCRKRMSPPAFAAHLNEVLVAHAEAHTAAAQAVTP